MVERITYRAEDTGYAVLRIQVPGTPEPITAVGNLGAAQVGEEVSLHGRWTRNPKYGPQLEVTSYRATVPSTVAGLRRYLGSGLIHGIGKELARRIVERFGERTLEVLDVAPETLREVGGIGEKRVQSIREAWREQKAIQAAMVFLQSHGASPLLAHRIWKRYAERTIDILHHDPYRLAQDIRGVGFKTADRIAQELGVPHDAPARAEAALLHVVGELTDDGHVWVPADDVLARAERDLDVPRAAAERALEQLRIHRRVESDPANPQLASDLAEGAPTQDSPSTALRAGRLKTQDSPLPSTALRAGPPALLAPASLAACERGIASSLAALLRTPAKPTPLDVPAALAWYESQASLRLAPLQREAIARGLSEKVLVITGGPGTGKTTLLRGILAVLRRKRVRTALAAPTGRAAKRMTEATGVAAQTIHRLLAFDPKTWSFTRRRDRTLEADVVVIDEASMLDVVLAHHLLAAVPREARLLLVGDVDQLPSVGPGHVLSDIIASGRVPVVRLTEVFRQAAKSSIVSAAHDIRRGAIPRSAPARGGDFYVLEEEPENVTARIVRLVADDIPRRLGLDPVTDIQVLCPMNRGRSGSQELNDALQARLNPGGTEAVSGWRRLRVGDRVMQIANDYDREVYNGDLGRIVAAGADSGEVTVEFDGRPVAYGARDLDELMLAYACSIHKAQGSEYPVVVVPLVPSHWQMLARNLLYTAVTRGKRLVLLVGSPRALGRAVRNDAPVLRCTKLVERLHEMIPDT
ncbi:MAG: ATP-dependent RecD-like DNA helicase [Deltaproteobacteria bacterium]|nr:ATP-dependent RecD-like DNA helicase [Deltaproteobacteria bacterium]